MEDYRKLLLNFSQIISDRELIELKFYLSGLGIGKRDIERVTNCLELWILMEERGLLSKSNTEELEKCLDCIKRQDLVNMLRNYQQKSDAPEKTDFSKEFQIILDNLPIKRWKMFMRSLNFKDSEIDEVVENHPNNVKEQISKLLIRWSKRSNSSKFDLVSALLDCECKLTAEYVKNST